MGGFSASFLRHGKRELLRRNPPKKHSKPGSQTVQRLAPYSSESELCAHVCIYDFVKKMFIRLWYTIFGSKME